MKVIFNRELFIAHCNFDERLIPKEAGFRWQKEKKFWYTLNHGVAARLREYCEPSAITEINRKVLVYEPWAHGLVVPTTEVIKTFQNEAAHFALARNKSYLALDPGLGKTPIAAVVASTLNKAKPLAFVYICPPFLTRNTEAEFKRWTQGLCFERYSSPVRFPNVSLILPDSILSREQTKLDIKNFTKAARERGLDTLLFVDEAHRFKNGDAGRTKALFGHQPTREKGIADHFDRIVYLSGTPMPNRPIELFAILNHSAPETIDNMSKFDYARKYCAAHQNAFGWDYSGASNIPVLAKKVMGRFMLRMKKEDVLTELPPKTEEMVLIGDNLTPKLAEMNNKILENFSPQDLMAGRLALQTNHGEDLHLATYRKELGLAKIPEAVKYIRSLLEDSDESLLVFAIHKLVIAELEKELDKFKPLVITGSTPMAARHEIVKKFQSDPSLRLFMGNIAAAGTGLTLTKATRVIFVEFSWVPADNDQASDRAHRIGQTDNVFVQYLVFQNSVDRAVLETNLAKKRITERLV